MQADFSDIRRLQILTDKLRKLVQILELNLRLGEQMKVSMNEIKCVSNAESYTMFAGIDIKLDHFIFQQQTSSSRISALIARAEGISQLVSHIFYNTLGNTS